MVLERIRMKMKAQDYSITIPVKATAAAAFEGITSVTRWWTENLKGKSKNVDDEFEVRFGDVHYSKQKLVEVIPNKKVVWLVTDSKLSFIQDKREWTNTRIEFEIVEENNATKVRFTHEGLLPDRECYGDCSNAWGYYLQQSLMPLINTGTGKPEPSENKVGAE